MCCLRAGHGSASLSLLRLLPSPAGPAPHYRSDPPSSELNASCCLGFATIICFPLTYHTVCISFFFKLRCSCFTVLCQFLLYSEMNQLCVYMYPHPLGHPSHPPIPPSNPSHPSRSSQSTELSSLCYTAASHWLSILHMVVYTCHSQPLISPNIPLYPSCSCLFFTSASLFLP